MNPLDSLLFAEQWLASMSTHETNQVEDTSKQLELRQKVQELFQEYLGACSEYLSKIQNHHSFLSSLCSPHRLKPLAIDPNIPSEWMKYFNSDLNQFSSSIAKHLQPQDLTACNQYDQKMINDLFSQHVFKLTMLSIDLENRVSNREALSADQLQTLVDIFKEMTPLLQSYSRNISQSTSLLSAGASALIKLFQALNPTIPLHFPVATPQPPVAAPVISRSSASSGLLKPPSSGPVITDKNNPLKHRIIKKFSGPQIRFRTGKDKKTNSLSQRRQSIYHSHQKAVSSSSCFSSSSQSSRLENPGTRKRPREETAQLSSSSSKRRKIFDRLTTSQNVFAQELLTYTKTTLGNFSLKNLKNILKKSRDLSLSMDKSYATTRYPSDEKTLQKIDKNEVEKIKSVLKNAGKIDSVLETAGKDEIIDFIILYKDRAKELKKKGEITPRSYLNRRQHPVWK